MLYVKNFTSYDDIKLNLRSGFYSGLLLKFGSETCPPCVALDKGSLADLTFAVNSQLEGSQLLTISINLSKQNPEILFTKLNIPEHERPHSIPAFYLFKYNIQEETLLRTMNERGYDMQNPKKWIENFSKLIVSKLK